MRRTRTSIFRVGIAQRGQPLGFVEVEALTDALAKRAVLRDARRDLGVGVSITSLSLLDTKTYVLGAPDGARVLRWSRD